MANTIRIKRSAATNVPAANLGQGELANSETGSPNGVNELYIGVTGPTNFKLIRNLNAAPAEPTAGLATVAIAAGDYMIFEDVSDSQGKRVLLSNVPLSYFNNDLGAANQTITTGLGIDGADAGDSGNITISLATVELANTAVVAADQFVFNDATDSLPKKQVASSIPISIWGAATAQVNMADFDLNRPVLEDYAVKHQALTIATGTTPDSVTVDCTLGNSAYVDLEAAVENIEVFLTNPPASGRYGEVSLIVQQGTTARTITWPTAVDWKGGTPSLNTTNNAVDMFHFSTIDGGTTWYGTYALETAGAGQANQTITSGLGIDGADAGDAGDITLTLATTELTNASLTANDHLVWNDASDQLPKKQQINGIGLGLFSNLVSEFVSENDTMVVVDWNWVLDEDAFGSNSAVHVATQQSIKAYVDNAVTGALTHKGGYNASTNTPALDTGSPVLVLGDMYTVTVAGTFFTVEVEVGDVLIADVDSVDAAALADWTIVQSNIGYASETVAGYIEIATQAEVDTLTGGSALLAVTPAYMHLTTFDGGTF